MFWRIHKERLDEGIIELRSLCSNYSWYVNLENIGEVREKVERIFFMDDEQEMREEGLMMLDHIEELLRK